MEILGWLANIIFVKASVQKTPRQYIAHCIPANMLYMVMYYEMHLFIAAFLTVITVIRGFSFFYLPDSLYRSCLYLLTFISLVTVALTMQYTADMLIFVAAIAIAASVYYRDQINKLRFFTAISQVLWFAHSIIFGVYAMIFTTCFIFGSIVYATLRDAGYLSKIRLKTTKI